MSEQRPANEAELVELLHAIDVPAPDALHGRVQALIDERQPSRGSRGDDRDRTPRSGRASLRTRLAAVGAIAAVALAVTIAVSTSTSSDNAGPSLEQATALTLSAATTGPPGESRSDHTEVTESVDGVSFPYWGAHFGWHTTGMRTDRVGGRQITTVFYANERGQRVGYAIVSGAPPKRARGGSTAWRGGTRYWVSSQHGVKVVTWLRGRHLCVVAGRGVRTATLLRLASWDDHHAVAS